MSDYPGPVLVTGANSGFGLASVLRFAARGWEVWGTVRSREKADMLLDAARAVAVENLVRPVVLNVSDHAAVTDAWPDMPDFYAVVNNAGCSTLGAIEEVTAAEARAQLDVNLIAPAVVSACALPGMRRLGGGRIVMVSSVAGRAALMPLSGWYHASKFGLEALSDVLRVEVAPFGVKVALIEPGFYKTGIETTVRQQADARREHDDSPYAAAYRRVGQLLNVVDSYAPPAEAVARTIVEAVESQRPKRRYVLGVDALAVLATQTFAPRGLVDAAMQMISDLRDVPESKRRQ